MIYRAVMGLAGVALVAASLYMTVTAALASASGFDAYVWALVAGCAGVAKIGLPLRRSETWQGAAALLILWGVCFCLDTFYHSSYQQMTKGAAVEARAVQIAAHADASRTVAALEIADRATPTPDRAREVVAADLAVALAAAGDCAPRRAHLDACQRVGGLKIERSGWEAKDRSTGELADARAKLAKLPEIELYPEFRNARTNLKSLGFDASGAALAGVVSVLLLFLFDGVPVALLHIAMTPATPKPRQRLEVFDPDNIQTPADVAKAIERARGGAPVPGVQRRADGSLKIVQGQLATALGIPARRVKDDLAAMGAVFGSHGTFVR